MKDITHVACSTAAALVGPDQRTDTKRSCARLQTGYWLMRVQALIAVSPGDHETWPKVRNSHNVWNLHHAIRRLVADILSWRSCLFQVAMAKCQYVVNK
jgi:hypothetical protein